ncbi:MAG: tetratricopeptide repeat protein, partial [Alphaproteobacteria bacterium]
LADTGRVAEAERLVRGFLDRHPDEAQGHLLLGVLLVATRRHAEARAVLERAIYLDPGCEDALLHLAALAESAGDRPAADRLRARAARLESPS